MMKNSILLFLIVFGSFCVSAQEDSLNINEGNLDEYSEETGPDENVIGETFLGTRVINGHSTDMLSKNELEFRIEHRFGDMLPDWDASQLAQTWLGFDQAADIRFGFEYGITDNFMLGIGRSRGTGRPYRALVDGFLKYRALTQNKEGMPISLALLGTTSFTYMTASTDSSMVTAFPKWEHRLAYALQMVVAKKFGNWLSLSLSPTMVHRNYVAPDDVNTLFALGGAARFGITETIGVIIEYFHVFHDPAFRTENTNSLGLAVEIKTFGHNFTINLTNSKGFGETQFIPYTYSDWLKGQFRIGFSIGRKFLF